MPAFNSPLMLGFDHLEGLLDQVSKSSGEGYPPYNIEQVGDDGLRIALAVAGFGIDDLSVSLESNQLVIRGNKRKEDRARVFLHRGIATRQFQRSFVIAEGIEIVGASLDSGLLNIDLRRELSESLVRTIKIATGDPGKAAREKNPRSSISLRTSERSSRWRRVSLPQRPFRKRRTTLARARTVRRE